MSNYCNSSWKDVVDMLKGNINRGLSEIECDARREEFGDNKIMLTGESNYAKLVIKCFLKGYIMISILVCILCIYEKNIILSCASGFMLIINIIVNITFVMINKKQLSYLERFNHSNVIVLRDGEEKEIKAQELVKGDIVIFRKSSLIGADLRIIDAYDIKVDEKNITGESFLKEKFESKIDSVVDNVTEMKNILFKGSVIKDGEGTGIVIETGERTQLGKLMAMIAYANTNKHTLNKVIDKKIDITCIILTVAAVLLFSITNRFMDALLLSLVLIVTVPTSIISTMYFKMLRKDLKEKDNIEIINFSVLDYINDIEFLFLDKIGSITKNEMIVNAIYTNYTSYNLNDADYDNDSNFKRTMDIMLLCNDAKYDTKKDTGKGNITEIAFLKYAAKSRIYKTMLEAKYKRIFEIPMDTDKRLLTSVNKTKKGYRANVRGTVESIIARCTHILIDGIEKEISEEDIEKIKAIDYNFSVEGLLAEGLAYRNFTYQPSEFENIESNLVFVGIVALCNPFYDNIQNKISELKEKGITPIVFTDDNIIAATTMGIQANLISDANGVISGVEMNSLTKDEYLKVLGRVKVFSRVTPEIKSNIVGIFTKDNYKIACSGETLGDFPSLSLAKVGIGKGNITEIAKKVSDVYIKENFLEGFYKVFDVAKNFKFNLNIVQYFFITYLLSQMLILNIASFMNINYDFNLLIATNFIFLIPLSLINLTSNNLSKIKRKEIGYRLILWTCFSVIAIYNVKEYAYIILITVFQSMIFIYEIIVMNISFRKISRNLIFLILSVIILIAVVVSCILITNISFSSVILIKAAIIIILYLIIELIIRKWK